LTKAIELDPKNAVGWYNRGSTYYKLHQYDKAVADFSKAIELDPKNAAAWGNRAGTYNELQQYDKALSDLNKAIELDPKNASAWYQRGMTQGNLAQWDKASADFSKAIEVDPGNPWPWYARALVRLQQGDHAGFRKACAGMLEHFGQASNVEGAYATVWTCIQVPDAVDDWTQPAQLAEKALAGDPNNIGWLTTLGAVLYRAGRFEEAAQRLTEAEAAFQKGKDPAWPVAYTWLFLAMAHERLGHTQQARDWLAKAVRDIKQPPPERAALYRSWNRQLTFRLLRREAEALLKVTASDQPRPKEK
jgi:tetratricopeptide (TPR) repeat protein